MLSRWARLKAESNKAELALPVETVDIKAGQSVVPAAVPTTDSGEPVVEEREGDASVDGLESQKLPSLEDLTPESDFKPFMRAGVEPAQRNAALKKLFTDPHYNIMDGLDIYIDDYGKPDPIPAEMLRGLVQSQLLGLFKEEEEEDKEEDKEQPETANPESNISPAELNRVNPEPTPSQD
jgi:Protein of unknown function (DUF3306)